MNKDLKKKTQKKKQGSWF